MTFAALFVSKKRDKKVSLCFYTAAASRRPTREPKSRQQPKQKIKTSTRFFFCICRRKRKSYQKENAVAEISRSAERDKSYALLMAPPFEKGGRKLYLG